MSHAGQNFVYDAAQRAGEHAGAPSELLMLCCICLAGGIILRHVYGLENHGNQNNLLPFRHPLVQEGILVLCCCCCHCCHDAER